MKKFTLLSLMIPVVLVISGCSKDPGDVLADAMNEMCKSNSLRPLEKYMAPESKEAYNMLVMIYEGDEPKSRALRNELLSACKKKNNDKPYKVVVDGDWAQVWETPNSQNPTTLKKVDGEWKIYIKK